MVRNRVGGDVIKKITSGEMGVKEVTPMVVIGGGEI
jgi:hypothetical protein